MSIITFKKKKPDFTDRLRQPFEDFFNSEASSGIVLLLAALTAIVIANTPFAGAFEQIWQTRFTVGYGDFLLSKPLLLWVNDGLMAIFFFYVGLEIKRELMIGELNSIRSARLPVMAAIGGMLFPALIYVVFNAGTEGSAGWGIPMATDIAFSLGILMLLGKRVPLSLKIFLTAVAIVDDLGAVLVIAIFYSFQLNFLSLGIGIGILALLFLINRMGLRHPAYYGVLGIILWVAFLKSGVHATIAGVLLAAMIPSRTKINGMQFIRKMRTYLGRFEGNCKTEEELWANQEQQEALKTMEITCHQAESPMQRMEHDLQPWVAWLIMPVFALANAGITFTPELVSSLLHPVAIGVFFGLLIGKPLGIGLMTWITVRTGLSTLPEGVSWRQVLGLGFLAGIGFTMSIFINNLAFTGSELVHPAKAGIIAASLVAAITGILLLSTRTKEDQAEAR